MDGLAHIRELRVVLGHRLGVRALFRLNVRVVPDHRHTVLGQHDVEFQGRDSHIECVLESLAGLFGVLAAAAAVCLQVECFGHAVRGGLRRGGACSRASARSFRGVVIARLVVAVVATLRAVPLLVGALRTVAHVLLTAASDGRLDIVRNARVGDARRPRASGASSENERGRHGGREVAGDARRTSSRAHGVQTFRVECAAPRSRPTGDGICARSIVRGLINHSSAAAARPHPSAAPISAGSGFQTT